MSDDDLEALRANVARHSGPARVRPLVELGVSLAQRYMSAGPQTLAMRPRLDEAIQVLDEAYDLLDAGEFVRGQVASQLGWLLGTRQAVHGGSDHDRDRSIRLLDESLSFTQVPELQQTMSRLFLGQFLLMRALHQLQGGDLVQLAMQPAPQGPEVSDAERAVELLRRVRSDAGANRQLSSAAETMLVMAEAVQSISGALSGGPGGFDMGRLMEAMTAMQDLQQQMAQQPPGAGFGAVPNPFGFRGAEILLTDPLQRPVMVVDGQAVAQPPSDQPPSDPEPPSPTSPVAADALRAALLGKLPGQLSTLLADGAVLPDVDTVDELVALGSSLIEESDAVGTDHLLLAVALYLRSLVDDGGGWGAEDGADDVRAAGDRLIAAAEAVALEPSDTVVVAVRLAALLDVQAPSREHLTRLADGFAAVTAALGKIGVDGLVYGPDGELLMLSAATGRLARVTGPLPDRILVAGAGPVPGEPIVSYVTSGGQVIELAERPRRPLAESVVFVANPRGDRGPATLDALLLRRNFHPRSVGLGDTAEDAAGAGTPDEVRARLDASLLHLGCGLTADGALELAGSTVLKPAEIAAGATARAAGGVAVLPPTVTGTAALTEALLMVRFVGVIGFRAPVPDAIATLMYLRLHAELVDEGRDPASAVRAVRAWMADPDRVVPAYVPAWCVGDDADLADPVHWDALVHHGV